MKRTFIAQDHMPPKLPVNHTALCLLLCHYFDAPQWVWTLVIVWVVLVWIVCIHDIANSQGRRIPCFGRKE
jgi:hypothetical protein